MRLPQQVDELLKAYQNDFHNPIHQRGKALAYKNKPKVIYYDVSNKTFNAELLGSELYQISIKLNTSGFSTVSSCTCPYSGTCKHIAAVVITALNFPERVKPDYQSTKDFARSSPIKLKGIKKSGEHHITGGSLSEMAENCYLLPNRQAKHYTAFNIVHQLIDNNLVHSHLYARHHRIRNNDEDSNKCIFQFEDNKIIARCEECSFSKNELCHHTHEALKDLFRRYDMLGEHFLNYDKALKKIRIETGIAPELFRKIGKITIGFRSHETSITDNSIVLEESLSRLRSKYDLQKEESSQILIQQLQGSLEKTEAIAWSSPEGMEYFDRVFIVEGKASKNGDKLASHVRPVEEPVLLNHETKKIYRAIVDLINSSTNYGAIGEANLIEKVSSLLKKNITILQSNINYLYDPEFSFYQHEIRLKKKDLKLFSFSEHTFGVKLNAEVKNSLYTLTQNWSIAGEQLELQNSDEIGFFHHFALINEQAYIYENPNTFHLLDILSSRKEIKLLPRDQIEYFHLLNYLENKFEVQKDRSVTDLLEPVKGCKKVVVLSEAGDHIVLKPFLKKGKMQFDLYEPNTHQKDKDKNILYPNELEIEVFKNQFESLHPYFSDQALNEGLFYLHINTYIADNWHIEFFETCKDLKILVNGFEDLERVKFSRHKAKVDTQISSGIDWFELNVTLSFGGEEVERKKWIKALKEGKNHVVLEDGTFGILPEEWMAKMNKLLSVAEVSGKKLQINKLRFNVLTDVLNNIDNKAILSEISNQKKLLNSLNDLDNKHPIPSSIQATLRPYQEASFQWLLFLQRSGFGGILADDMGLGKTLQLICLLASAKESDNCYALVVVPRSLIFNWVNEIEKFCPSLSCHVYHGQQRELMNEGKKSADVIISTYGTVVNDIALLQKETFSHIILDESQAIKNPASKRYKQIRLLQSPYKICATGTPIQNNTFDLYAQASFSNPGLLGNQSYFRQNFANPIDKDQDRDASDLLMKMIHPFILRRTKEQVAQDLPDKIESIIYCEMLPHQEKMYLELKEQIRKDLLLIDGNNSQMKFKVLDGLLRLRQLCNSPLLVDKKLKGKKAESIKIESLLYKLTEEIGDGNALVFSQFVQMLKLIKQELDDRNIPYAYLDGQTRNREVVVNAYMNDPNCRIFLISLKAGNTGLNLTKAQYVFLVDPWWNPAAEAQAIDRTHRIGQTKKVFAYKMVCKNTIEEKILLLQKKKKNVASSLIQVDENTFKNMSKKDLMSLFD